MSKATLRVPFTGARGADAARLRQHRYRVRRQHALPDTLDEMLSGALTLTHVRCGKATCHCATGTGHPAWHLTVQIAGRSRVIHIPATLVVDIQRRVDKGRAFQEAVRDVMAANAALFLLSRKQRR
ncbi:MAG TPA: DUF6788 family protein [bacterium]|nr:DUF6788 family protein [bacterium]